MARTSVLDGDGLDDRYREIQQVYLSDNRPWVVGYSGGRAKSSARSRSM